MEHFPCSRSFSHRRAKEVQQKVGLLYALNTFGAAFGTLVAALLFIPHLGNIRTTLLIAALNIGIGVFAIILNSRWSQAASTAVVEPRNWNQQLRMRPSIAPSAGLVLMTLAGSGFVSMLYEVAWTRALTAMIGSSTYAFSIMLVTFLIGIAAGSSIASRLRSIASLRLLGLTQLGVAFGGLMFLMGYKVAPLMVVGALRALFFSFPAMLVTQFVVCAFLMIVATICMGATIPIASQIYSSRLKLLGRSIGNIYSVNTLGAIAGSLIAGFVLVPLVGTERTVLAGMFFNAAMAALILSAPSAVRKRDLAQVGGHRAAVAGNVFHEGESILASGIAGSGSDCLREDAGFASRIHHQRALQRYGCRVLQGRQ